MRKTNRWYFTLKKGKGITSFEMVLYLKKKKFHTSLQVQSSYLLSFRQACWYWILFNLPKWIRPNGGMFAYKHTTGTVHLRRMTHYVPIDIQKD